MSEVWNFILGFVVACSIIMVGWINYFDTCKDVPYEGRQVTVCVRNLIDKK